ncbi:MAG: DUF1761 domain-containing protein [Proteobacteria bacterium]|nr:DUF1761 domain-containing protein [Pseudomonadota bacterium]MBI3496720.1 DUF1761 domain-containing protein [Pseudomonadota bacterium]
MANVNYLAVLLAGFASFMLGWAWYGGLFKNAWIKSSGITPEKIQEMQRGPNAARALVVTFLSQIVIALAIAVLIEWTGAAGWQQGLGLGLSVWIGFAAPFGLIANIHSGKSLQAFVIDAGYQLIYLALMGVVIGAWR